VGSVTVRDAAGSISDTSRVVDAASAPATAAAAGDGVGAGAAMASTTAPGVASSSLYRVSGSTVGGCATLVVAKLQLEVASIAFCTALPPNRSGMAAVALAAAPSRDGPTMLIRALMVTVAPNAETELPYAAIS
jgi:hypothetical protein